MPELKIEAPDIYKIDSRVFKFHDFAYRKNEARKMVNSLMCEGYDTRHLYVNRGFYAVYKRLINMFEDL